ncbi:Ig-like domain-containing protein [Vibrio sp. NTOU-M3]|uniref:Ig-like domain-containing protein n=1 Tax=Vibrio sp. NTOU-M3 TaxID=3234954 RepID=UPI00349F6A04
MKKIPISVSMMVLAAGSSFSASAEVMIVSGVKGDLIPPNLLSRHWNNYKIVLTNTSDTTLELHDQTFSFTTPIALTAAPWGLGIGSLQLEPTTSEGEGYRNNFLFKAFDGVSMVLQPGAAITMEFGYGQSLDEQLVESSFRLFGEGGGNISNAPSVTLLKPETDLTIVSGEPLLLQANADDVDGDLQGVKFFANDHLLVDDQNEPYELSVSSLEVGTHSVYVKAYDADGNTTQSAVRKITVEADKGSVPEVALTAPTGNVEIELGDSVLIAANAIDVDGDLKAVELYVDGYKMQTINQAPYQFQFTPINEGVFAIHVVAVDAAGNQASSTSYSIKVAKPSVESIPPVVSLQSPAGNIVTLVNEQIPLIAQASDADGDLKSVRFFANGALIAEMTQPPYATSMTAKEGETAVYVEAEDYAGNVTRSGSISVVANTLSEGTGSGEGGACDVPQYVNGTAYVVGDKVQNNGSIYVCKQFGWCGQAPYEPGVNWQGAEFWKDAWMLEGACDAKANNAPTIALTAPEVTDSAPFHITAATNDDDGSVVGVDYYISGALYRSVTTPPFTLEHEGLVQGEYAIFAVATDDLGAQTRSETLTLNVAAGFEGNRLTLTFPAFEHKDLLDPPAELQNQVLTGSLYCPEDGSRTPVQGSWGETVHLDGLSECQYQLNLDGFSGYVARFSPWVIDFSKTEERQIAIDALYRAPIDTDALFPLGGVQVETYLEGIYQPRSMAMGDNMLFVGSSSIMLDNEPLSGTVYAVELDPQTKKPVGTYIVAEGEEPHGVAYRDGTLYYSTVGALYKIENIKESFKNRPKAEKIFTYPADGEKTPIPSEQWWTRMQHQKHPLKFNTADPTDKKLYTAAGLPCNICTTPEEELYGTIFSIDLETGQYDILANGIRNAVGFDWHPKTGEIWFSDNNRQQFDNPDEINHISNPGNQNFGAPIFFGKDTRGLTDEEMANWEDLLLGGEGSVGYPIIPPKAILPQIDYDVVKPTDFAGAAFDIFTNSAPLGVKFWNAFSKSDNVQHLVYATHGNSKPEHPGLELRMVTIENGNKIIHERPLVTGWMRDRNAVESYACLTDACIGRPVEFLEMPDGSMLVSDDKASVIYRVAYDATLANIKQVTFTTTEAPDVSVQDEMVSGALIHPNGHESKFHVAWGASDMIIDGLKNGTYKVRLNDIGDYIPEQRNSDIVISDAAPKATVALKYIDKPVDLQGTVSFTAPSKPTGATESGLLLTIVNQADHTSIERQVAWGETLEAQLGYGSYEILYPYLKGFYPSPLKENININESSLEHNLNVSYVGYSSGADLMKQNCTACHSTDFFDNANKANTWQNAGYEALINKIMSMPVAGHCDRQCAEEIADYLFDEVWDEYLNVGDSFGSRQVRLLSSLEYANSIKDLFGLDIDKNKLPKDKYSREFKFAGQSSLGVVLTEDMKKYHAMAVDISQRIDEDKLGYSNGINKAQYINEMGLKVYRRPLTADEVTRFTGFIDQYGARDMLAAMLLSPNFLYRSELGEQTAEANVYELTPYELATALSYSFLGTTPSSSLLAKAERGELATNEQVAAEVAAMIQSPRGIQRFTDFVGYYVHTQVQELPVKPGLSNELVERYGSGASGVYSLLLNRRKGHSSRAVQCKLHLCEWCSG